MRFPDLVTEVLAIKQRLEAAIADLDHQHTRISAIQRELRQAHNLVPRETPEPTLLDVIEEMTRNDPS